jgi:hypothetical protein
MESRTLYVGRQMDDGMQAAKGQAGAITLARAEKK